MTRVSTAGFMLGSMMNTCDVAAGEGRFKLLSSSITSFNVLDTCVHCASIAPPSVLGPRRLSAT
jgi:hypothetical protein